MNLRWFLFLFLFAASCAGPKNLHRVDTRVWRSAQPDAQASRELKAMGVKEVLCLRNWHADRELRKDFKVHWVPMEAHEIRDRDVVNALKTIRASEGPILIHCWHGSDRTGVVVAMYRMTVQGWSRQRAIDELSIPAYGHHAAQFPNIRRYLETVDVEKIRREAGIPSPPSSRGFSKPEGLPHS